MALMLSLAIALGFVTHARANHNAVGQLPIMGWSGYNAFMQNTDERMRFLREEVEILIFSSNFSLLTFNRNRLFFRRDFSRI